MDIRKLNESLSQLLEGEVVSLLDYKREKNANRRKERSQEFVDQYGDELQKQVDDFYKDKIKMEIAGVYINTCETLGTMKLLGNGETRSFEDFQRKVFEIDYVLQKFDKLCKLSYTAYIIMNDEPEQKEFRGIIELGKGKEEVEIINQIKDRTKKMLGKEALIVNDTYPVYRPEDYEKKYEEIKDKIEKNLNELPSEDYIKDYRKDPMDVQVGDILTCSWGYSMTLVDYYRVTERKAKSIKLEKLESKILTGGGYQGTCMPTDKRAPDRYQTDLENKLFRIGVKWSKEVVCQINGHSVYYWDGNPDSYDHMD